MHKAKARGDGRVRHVRVSGIFVFVPRCHGADRAGRTDVTCGLGASDPAVPSSALHGTPDVCCSGHGHAHRLLAAASGLRPQVSGPRPQGREARPSDISAPRGAARRPLGDGLTGLTASDITRTLRDNSQSAGISSPAPCPTARGRDRA
ncbi:hypothetical protein WOLCODRAFT_137644 [Wolfiporia cocos MD-104 SS10]|uniref:Uncharacterized protein n=1 Tax=Wolfiporia cocos (strain MD-104) TaxID=742152 RepID=A0A2H3JII0_WOLCO|nr:hypothetical protein WOLCODRAFT_137644 [Wolfiporia cocos MD-104 SS10]